MLKIKQTETKFLKGLHIGIRAFTIELSEFGYEEETINLAEAGASFSYVLIYGDEPFKNSKGVSDLCKEIQKLNPHTHIIIYTSGMVRPVGMNSIKNAEYVIDCKLKASKIPFDERINELTWNWIAKTGGKFIFSVKEEDDFDEINIILSALLIHKSQIYINIKDGAFKELAFTVLNKGYNLYIDFEGELFETPKE